MATLVGSASFRLIDVLGVRVPKIVYFQAADTATLAQVISDLESYAALLDPMTDAASFAHVASFDINFADAALKSNPNNPGNPNSLNGASSFAETGTGQTFTDVVPAIAQAQVAGGKIVDGTGTPYLAYRSAFVTPFPHITLISQDQRTLAAFHNSDIPTRKYRRQQRRVTTGS